MSRYANRGGDSGITTYEVTATSITVGFRDGSCYLYDYSSPGQADVEEMKRLAQAGQGLNEFINRHVRKRYARKLH